jgi:hypothetical protein
VEADGLRRSHERLQRYATDLATSLSQASTAGAASRSPAAADAAHLLADMQSRIDEAAGTIAVYADSLRISGESCVRLYESAEMK